jgi:hypothetical protein
MSTPKLPMEGGCQCGAVRYKVTRAPVLAVECYCLHCQKTSGAGHALHFLVPAPAFELQGKTQTHAMKADSGNTTTSSFCPVCGSPIHGSSTGFAQMVTVRAASLDDSSALRPKMAVYTKRLQAWDHLDPALPAFPESPPMK